MSILQKIRWKNTLQISTTQTYYLLNITKYPISLKKIRHTRIHWLQGQMINTTVLISRHVGTIVTHNHKNKMIIVSSPILRTMFLNQILMVNTSRISGVVVGLTSSTTKSSLHTFCHPWIFCLIMLSIIFYTHKIWCVNFRSWRFLGKVIINMIITQFWTPSTQRSGRSE